MALVERAQGRVERDKLGLRSDQKSGMLQFLTRFEYCADETGVYSAPVP